MDSLNIVIYLPIYYASVRARYLTEIFGGDGFDENERCYSVVEFVNISIFL